MGASKYMETSEIIKIEEPEFVGERLDHCLSLLIEDYSRSAIKKSIDQGKTLVNGEQVDPDYKVRLEDVISFTPPEQESSEIIPEDISLNIVYEDDHIIVVNKPYGLVVHPALGNWRGTLANGILGYLKKKIEEVPLRVGIVHRLDKDTSGLMVIAKDDATMRELQRQFANKLIEKKYYALVWGIPAAKEGIINAPIGRHPKDRKRFAVRIDGKEAVTHYKTLESYSVFGQDHKISLLEVSPKTGRTHQIRVHLSKLGYPIVGDLLYGKSYMAENRQVGASRQMLHAFSLKFTLPAIGEKTFQTGRPEDMEEVLKNLSTVDGK